jgi:hypothetical protein
LDKAMQHARDRIRELTRRSRLLLPVEWIVEEAKWAYCHLCVILDIYSRYVWKFLPWCNDKRCYGGLGPHAAADIHYGRAGAVRAARVSVPHRRPRTLRLQTAALLDLPAGSWINPPDQKEAATL